jgi:fructokinase
MFDINLRQSYFSRRIVEDSLKTSTVLKLNDEELPVVAGLLGITGPEKDVLSHLAKAYDLSMIALTRGAGGSCLYAGGSEHGFSASAVEVVDTVGAGDAFAAAVAVGLLRGMPPEAINAGANRLAGYVCSQAGATPAIDESLVELVIGQ